MVIPQVEKKRESACFVGAKSRGELNIQLAHRGALAGAKVSKEDEPLSLLESPGKSVDIME